MTIIIDKKAPAEAKANLGRYGEAVEFATSGIVYEAISGHPDIFLFENKGSFVVSPSLPEEYISVLNRNCIKYKTGKMKTSAGYPATAHYNAVALNSHLVHKLSITDETILAQFPDEKRIDIKQGYGRCSIIPLKGKNAIVSDMGIYAALEKAGFNVIYVSPEGIVLPGFKNGFIGGTCGVYKESVYFLGSLQKHIDGEKIRSFLLGLKYNVVELCDTPLFDGGSIIFME